MKKRKRNFSRPPDNLTLEERRNLIMVKIGHHIETEGAMLMNIFGEGDKPSFVYTIGYLVTWEHPELITFGLQHEQGSQLISVLLDEIKAGRRFEPGQIYTDVAAIPLYIGEMFRTRVAESLGTAMWFYQKPYFPVLQVIWSDGEGHFPWQEGFKQEYKQAQPLHCLLPKEP